jgi:lipopolysaccharide export system protein LptA
MNKYFYFRDVATLTVTRGKMKEVTAELVSAMNSGPHSDGFVVIADNVTTTTGSTSIQGDDVTVSTSYLGRDISSVAIVTS